MGQKVHPGGLRVGVIHDWKSNWYTTNKDFKDALLEDIKIREHINRKLGHAGLSTSRSARIQRITIDTGRRAPESDREVRVEVSPQGCPWYDA
jgi:hypothetical protein